jgi:hypothetical protein
MTTHLTIAIALAVAAGVSAGVAAQVTPLPPRMPTTQGVTPQPERPPTGAVLPMDSERRTPQQVFAIGAATIFAGNAAAARQAALQAAYAEAVARGAGVEIGRLTLVRNVRAVSDIVASRSKGYVKSYEVVGESIVEDTPPRYEIRINAVVAQVTEQSTDADGLKLFLEVMGNPRLLVLLPEAAFNAPPPEGQSSAPTPWGQTLPTTPAGMMRGAEAAIAQAFGAFGYQVLTSDDVMAAGAVTSAQLERARQGITLDAITVARSVGADLLLAGNVQLSWQRVRPQDVEFVSATTVASAKALVVSNGYIIEAFSRSITKAHTSALGAITSSLQSVAAEFAGALAWKVPSILASRPRVTRVAFSNVDLALANRLKTGLESLDGVDAVRFATLPTATHPAAEFELLSGYVLFPQEELVARCIESAGRQVQLVSADKFIVRLNVM